MLKLQVRMVNEPTAEPTLPTKAPVARKSQATSCAECRRLKLKFVASFTPYLLFVNTQIDVIESFHVLRVYAGDVRISALLVPWKREDEVFSRDWSNLCHLLHPNDLVKMIPTSFPLKSQCLSTGMQQCLGGYKNWNRP